MHLDYLTRVERELHAAVRCAECANRFDHLMISTRETPEAGLRSWADVRRHLDGVGLRNPATDRLLAPLLAAHKSNPDEQSNAIALFLFFSPLTTIHRSLRRHDRNEDARCSNVLCAFLSVLNHLETAQRVTGLGKKLLNDAQHEVLRLYAHERAGRKKLRQMPDDEDDDIADQTGGDDLGMALADSELNRQWTCARMRALVRRGEISEPDYLILLGCFLYGHPLREMAARLGLTYDAAKKQRQRALARLEERAPHLSPTDPDSPLVWVGRPTERR